MKSFCAAILIWLSSCLVPLQAQEVSIIFRVNMAYQSTLGTFNPAQDFVDVAGSFNGWDGSSNRLTDSDNDLTYEVTIDGFTPGDIIEFKFRINGQWNGQEEFPGGGPNRRYTVAEGNNEIDVWYGDEIPPGGGFSISFSASSSTAYSESILRFRNQTAGEYDAVSWIFEGGVPAHSSLENPLVRYDAVGAFDVSLIVSDDESTDTLYFQDFIQIKDRQDEEISWWNDAVFYEIFVRSFKDSDGDGVGDFRGLTEQLDYLNDGDPNTEEDLGIGGIWLMPVHPSPSYHGYDVTDYRGINPDYGSLADFTQFLEEAHARGIRVIIDLVINHSSDRHPWFVESGSSADAARRDWYRWTPTKPAQQGPWGQNVWHSHPSGFYYGVFFSGMPDLNYETPEVREEIFDIADFWLNEVGVDGFRLDAVKYLLEEGSQLEDSPATLNFWKEYQSTVKNLNPGAFSVGEAWTSTDKVLDYVEDGGLDLCFEFDMAGAILDGVNQQQAGIILDQAQKIYNVYPHIQYGTFLTNHDMERAMNRVGNNQDRMRLAASVYLTLPGTPFLYYGEEIGMRGTKPDEFIRTPMQWTSGAHAGFTSGSPWIGVNSNYTSSNVEVMRNTDHSLLNQYRQLIQLRNEQPALRRGHFISITSSDSRVLSFARTYEDETLIIIINLSTTANRVADLDLNLLPFDLAAGTYEDLITGQQISLNPQGKTLVDFHAESSRVWVLKKSTATSLNDVVESRHIKGPFPNPATNHIYFGPSDFDIRSLQIIDVNGRILHAQEFSGQPIDVSSLPEGTYLIRLQTPDDLHVKKLVIQK